MKIKVRGITYRFEVHQQKNDLSYLVLLHGFMGSGDSFKHLIPSLTDFCNPITIDLLGHGKTEGSEMHYRFSSNEQVADICKLIGEQFPTPLYVLGYSMGGRLALQSCLKRPDLFLGLILESTTFGLENLQERQARQALDAQRADSIMGNFESFLKEWNNMPLFKAGNLSEKQKNTLTHIQRNQNPVWIGNTLLGFGTGTMPFLGNYLDQLSLPVKLIAGSLDTKFVNIMNSMLKKIDNCSLSIIKNAAHRVHFDQQEIYISLLSEFIKKNHLS